MGDTPGFEIKGRFYPFPVTYRIGDPVLVTEITGLDWMTFADRMDDADYEGDPVMLAGVIAVGIWQKHDTWRRERVLTYTQKVDLASVKMVGVDVAEEDDPDAEAEGDAGPPDEAPPVSGSSSEKPPQPSNPTPDSPSGKPNRKTSGPPGSATGST